jgi:hypothetical protein
MTCILISIVARCLPLHETLHSNFKLEKRGVATPKTNVCYGSTNGHLASVSFQAGSFKSARQIGAA